MFLDSHSPPASPSNSDLKPRKKSKSSYTTSFGPFRLGRTIGQGEFGKVKLAYHLQTNKEVAIKFVKKLSVDSVSKRKKLIREISIFQSISHRYIVKLDQVMETEAYIGLIMEHVSGGELFEYILAREYLSENESGRLFAQLIDAVSYLHINGIIHRDLKLENILLDQFRNLKLTDFGFANVVRDQNEGLLKTSCGSPCYAAPELVVHNEYIGELADIWSCGVILYAMLCGTLPYDDDPNNINSENLVVLYKYILETTLKFPVPLSKEARHLVGRILNTDPSKRANLTEIKSHPWLRIYTTTFQAYVKQENVISDSPVPAPSTSPSQPISIPGKSETPPKIEIQVVPENADTASSEQNTVPDEGDNIHLSEDIKSASVENTSMPLQPASLFIEPKEKIGKASSHFISQSSEALEKPRTDIVTKGNEKFLSETCQLNFDEKANIDREFTEIPIHDLRSQIIPTLEVMTEEEVTAEIILHDGPRSESIDLSDPLSDVPILSKQMSVASIGSQRLHRKSTTSFLFLEKPSIARASNNDVQVEEILSDDPNDSVLKIERDSDIDQKDTSTSSSSNSPKKVVSFPDDHDEAATPDEKKASLIRKPRYSLNINIRPRDSSMFREEAHRAQSMDVRRGSETPSMATSVSTLSQRLGFHSGPIDQRAITIFTPLAVLEKIQLVLLELKLSFTQSPDNPFKLIVTKNPSGFSFFERPIASCDSSHPSIDLKHQSSKGSGISRTSMQSSRSGNGYSKKQSSGPIGSMVTSLFQKIRYISMFGFQYNRGYDGSTLLPPVRNQNRVDDSFVQFHIIIHKIRYISGIFIVDLKRHKGDIWEFKRLYNEIIVKLDLKGTNASFL